MKTKFCLLWFIVEFCCMPAIGKVSYYYYNGQRTPIELSDDSVVVYSSLKSNGMSEQKQYSQKTISMDSSTKGSFSSIEYIVKEARGINVKMSNRFYVQLLDSINDVPKLLRVADNMHVTVKHKVPYMPDWYELVADQSIVNNTLELSNCFYETGLFKNVDPGFIFNFKPLCVSDSYYSSQWGVPLLNACNAWGFNTGDTNVRIAIIDGNIYTSHTEFSSTLFVDCYNTTTHTPIPSTTYSNHGTMVCGIIASDHNHARIAGMAPQCSIMPISYTTQDTAAVAANLASGISWAVQHNADVINCSWGDHNGQYHYVHSGILESAIMNALLYGRDEKGCVVVFAAGNQNTNQLDYPAYIFEDILTVGAIDQSSHRAWYSSFGNALDITAPGSDIYSTIQDNLYNSNSGTSYAAPYVTSIAGLVLSENSFLTQNEVVSIIESTAKKITGYTFATHSNRHSGTWNDSVGYGLADAYAAVKKANSKYIQGQDYICNTDTIQFHLPRPSQPGETVTWSVNSGLFSFLQEYFIVGSTHNDSVWVRRNSPNSGIGQLKPLVPPTISVTITNGTTSKTYTKELRLPYTSSIPSFTASNTSSGWAAGTTRTFTITNCTDVPDYMFRWEVMKIVHYPAGTDTTYEDFDGRTLHYTPSIPVNVLGSITIKAINTKKECGTNWSSSSYGLYNPSILLTAQPEGNTLYINILEETEEELRSPAQLKQGADYSLELWHSLYGRMCTQVVQSTAEQINISGYPQGVYVLLLKENDNIIAQTKLIIQ